MYDNIILVQKHIRVWLRKKEQRRQEDDQIEEMEQTVNSM